MIIEAVVIMYDNTFFINYLDEYNSLKEQYGKNNNLFICRNYSLFEKIYTDNVVYYYKESSPDEGLHNLCNSIAKKWFLSDDGTDEITDRLSIGLILAARINASFSNYLKEFISLIDWINVSENIFISNAESIVLKDLLDSLSVDYFEFDSRPDSDILLYNQEEMALIFNEFPRIHWLSQIARYIQRFIFPNISRRYHLFITDWTLCKLFKKRKDTLFQNNLMPHKGYYYNCHPKYIEKWSSLIPLELPALIQKKTRIKDIINDAFPDYESNIISIFQKLANRVYKTHRDNIIRTIAIYDELLDYYKPKIITIPGETHFAYVILSLLAKERGIITLLIIDGYLPFKDSWIYYKHNNKLLFDYVIGFGTYHVNILHNIGYKKNQIIKCRPTIIEPLIKNTYSKREYDVLVFAYNVHQDNPQSRWDKKFYFISNILDVLIKNDYNNIILKLKEGRYDKEDNYIDIINRYKKKFNRLDIIQKPTSEIISQTKICIGQISSAIIEATYLDKDYFIYEPYESGKTDEMISSSYLFNKRTISRTADDLEMNIRNGTPSIIGDNNKIFDGIHVSKINLSNLV